MDIQPVPVRSSPLRITLWMSLALGILLLTVAPEGVSAQDLSIGGRLGLVGGEVYFEDIDANDLSAPKPGLQMGGVAAYRLGPVLSLQAELWYVQKGWNETLYGGGRRLSYLEMPLLVVVTAPWKTAPQLIAGASVGVELACSVTGVPHVGCVDCSDSRVKWLHRKLQFATWFGFGVRRRFGASQLQVQFLGNYNLTNLNREPLPRGWARLFSGALSVAYLVPLGGTRP
jgi:hypothetical protein